MTKAAGIKLFILITLSAIIRVFIASNLELTNDEVYYRLYAMYPDFSHFDHPPMVGWLIQLTTLNLLLGSEFFIRLGAIILGCITLILAFKIGQKIHSDRVGFISAFLFTLSPYLFLISGTFILPDTPLLFFFMLALWLIITIFDDKITTKKANKLLVLGLVIGLAILSKYTAIFLWIGIGLYILLHKRNYLKQWQLYVSIFITIICLFPVIYWNIQNDFISFTFHNERVSLFSSICFSCFLQEIAGECAYNNPFIFVMIYFVFFRFCFQKNKLSFFAHNTSKNLPRHAELVSASPARTHYTGGLRVKPAMTNYFRLFYCIGLPLVILFLLFSFFRSLLPHWNAPGYSVMIFPVAIYIAEKFEQGKKSLWIQAKIWAGILLCIIILFFLQLNYNIFNLQQRKIQDFTIELSTWKKTGEFFAELSQKAEKNGEIQPNAPIIAHRWFPAANLDMYVAKPTNRKVLAIGSLEKIHKYAWINASRGGFELGMDAWYITDNYDFNHPDKVSIYFEIISPPDTLKITRNNETCKEIYVYKLGNMRELP
jgi:4-amino-4-deoxy-L-arabinose transferase-like glycosyltransferase